MQSVQAAQEPMSTVSIKAKEVKVKLTRKRGTVTVLIKNPKVAVANLTRMGKATTVPRVVMGIVRRKPKAVVARPTGMEKGNMATKVVMENLMATKKHQPMEGSGYFMLIGRYKQSGGKLLLKEGQTLALVLAKQKMGYGINRNPLF